MIKISTLAAEGALKVAQAIELPLLISGEEMRSLLTSLQPLFLFATDRVLEEAHIVDCCDRFLSSYERYIAHIMTGVDLQQQLKSDFQCALSCSESCFYRIAVPVDRWIIKCNQPVIQIQPHRFSFSSVDHKVRSHVFGGDTISWGVTFSFPQLFQDPRSYAVERIGTNEKFLNASLFQKVRAWVRQNTTPTPFLIDDKVVNVPIRLGRACASWIAGHPHLQERNIVVKGAG